MGLVGQNKVFKPFLFLFSVVIVIVSSVSAVPVKNVMTHLSDICEYYCSVCYPAIIQKSSFFFTLLLLRLFSHSLDFSQNKLSHHFLWNLWFLSVYKIIEHCSASANLDRAPCSAS